MACLSEDSSGTFAEQELNPAESTGVHKLIGNSWCVAGSIRAAGSAITSLVGAFVSRDRVSFKRYPFAGVS